MSRPDSNVSPGSQPWARSIEGDLDANAEAIRTLAEAVAAVSRGDGSQAGTTADMQTQLNLLQFQLKFLYGIVGQVYPPVSGGTPPPPPAPSQTVTVEIRADWSRTWGSSTYYTGGGTDTNGTYLYQGSSPENKIGMFHFDTGPVINKNITGVSLFMQNINTTYAPSVVANLGTHGNVTAPTGKPSRINAFDIGWNRGEGKWVGIPQAVWGSLANGGVQGFTVGGAGASNAQYAYWQGVGQSSPPVLRVTYQT